MERIVIEYDPERGLTVNGCALTRFYLVIECAELAAAVGVPEAEPREQD